MQETPQSSLAAPRKPRKRKTFLDHKAALRDAERGLTATEIAAKQGVALSTAWRWLERMMPERKALQALKAGHSDALIHLHGLALGVKERILRRLDEGVIESATPSQMASLLIATNISAGTDFDKSRLLDGQSTSNLGVLGRVIHEVHVGGIHGKVGSKPNARNLDNSSQSDETPISAQAVTVIHNHNES